MGNDRRIVLLDDNLALRDVVRIFIETLESKYDVNFQIYSSDNGVEGLGYIYVLEPDLVIIDTTLPKYSGREFIQYLISNEKFHTESQRIIIIHQEKVAPELPYNFLTINKADTKFLKKLLAGIAAHFGLEQDIKLGFWDKVRMKLGQQTLEWANTRDILLYNYYQSRWIKRFLIYMPWLVSEIAMSIWYTLFRLISSSPPEESIVQKERDIMAARVRYYPTLLSLIGALLVTLIQLATFLGGGVVLFGIRLDPAFAFRADEAVYKFEADTADDYDYDHNLIEISDAGAKLKAVAEEEDKPEGDEPAEDDSDKPDAGLPESYPSGPSVQGLESDGGVERVEERMTETPISYPTLKPALTLKEGIIYSKLDQIKVESETQESTALSYQLSPDGDTWYYYSAEEDSWNKTEQGALSSNTIPELNENLAAYEENLDSGELYLRVFFHSSSGTQTPTLKKIIIERETDAVEKVSDELPVEPSLPEVEVSGALDFEALEPVIFNAAHVNGNKVVLGKVLLKDKNAKVKYEITAEELAKYEAKVYFSTADKAIKGDPIGTTDLYLNSRGEIEFLLRTPAAAGGHVTAEIALKGSESGQSALAKPLENSTFTVDSTGDEADTSAGDGLCQTGVATCTLRAAIEEANGLGGADNINFNIPAADPGYRDYDTQDTVSSGDGAGSDDYWTIRPATAFPAINETIAFNGSTQGINQGQTNGSDPEIELSGINIGVTNISGLQFNTGAAGSSVETMVINAFKTTNSSGINMVSTNNIEVTSSYLGVDAKGLSSSKPVNVTLGNFISIRAFNSTAIQIGNNTSDGNVIGGDRYRGDLISLDCAAISAYPAIQIRGNKIGLNKNGNQAIANSSTMGYGIHSTNYCTSEVGGDNANHRNYIGGLYFGIYYTHAAADIPVGVYNNFFSTDTTGTQLLSSFEDVADYSAYFPSGTLGTVKIGDVNKGNIFRADYGIDINNSRPLAVRNNVFTNKWAGIWNWLSGSEIKYNYFSMGPDADPYFGISYNGRVASGNNYNYGLFDIGDMDSVIQGNIFHDLNLGMQVNSNNRNNLNLADDINSFATIGGTGNDPLSLCKVSGVGKEANCFSSITAKNLAGYPDIGNVAGILFLDAFSHNQINRSNPTNYVVEPSRIYQENVWGANVEYAAMLSWTGNFEILSGSVRRTDLQATGVKLPLPSQSKLLWTADTEASIFTVNCSTPTPPTCVGGTTAIANYFQTPSSMNNPWSYSYLAHYVIDGSGNLSEYPIWKFDYPHFASKTFSFDGDASTHPQTTPERGEPWTRKPHNDSGTPGDNSDDIGVNINATYSEIQNMEVEYVDANPVLQNDGSYVITVDSTSDEDNVSTLGFDDGGGAYSGGGVNGTNGISNGRTSLREAMIVANNHAGPEIIRFNIPTADGGYINPDGSRNAPAQPAGTYPATPGGYWRIDSNTTYLFSGSDGIYIDGYSQPGATRNTAGIGSTLSGRIVIQVNQPVTRFFNINNSDNNHIAGLNIRATAAGANPRVNIVNDSDNNWIEGNYFGSDINGDGDLAMWAKVAIGGLSDNNIIGTNRDGNNDLGEKNLITGNNNTGVVGIVNLSGGALTPALNNIISGNYIGTDKTGKVCPGYTIHYAAIINYEFATNTEIGSNLDNNNDAEEGNIFGCVTHFHRGAIRQWGDGVKLYNNFINIAPDGSSLAPADDGSNRSGVSHIGTNGKYYYNTIKGYPSGSAFHFRDDFVRSFAGTELKHNKFSGPAQYGVWIGGQNIAPVEDVVIENNEFSGFTGHGILIETNGLDITIRSNKYTHSATGAVINLEGGTEDANKITANDLDDEDTGANDLQNFPTITKVEYYKATNKYRVYGDLYGKSGEGSWAIEVCESDGHSSGHGGCIQTLGFETANSPWVVEVTIPGSNGTDARVFSALATNASGSTSEFSANFVADEDNDDYDIIEPPVTPLTPPASPTVPPAAPPTGIGDQDGGGETEEDIDPDPVPTSGGFISEPGILESIEPWQISIGILFSALLTAVFVAFILGPLSDFLSRIGIVVGVFLPKRRRYWGIVYDIEESRVAPFVAVELIDRSGNLVERTITDLQGKYALKVKAGDYSLIAKAPGYKMFSKVLVLRNDSEVIEDIPLEKLGSTLKGSLKAFLFYRKQEVLLLGRNIYSLLVLLGFIFTVYACVISPILINYLILGMYILMGLLLLLNYLKTKSYGGRVVDSADNSGLGNVVVRFYRNSKLEDIALSNASGAIKANLQKGEIGVYAQKVGYQDNKDSILLNDSGNLDRDIIMQKVTSAVADAGDNKFQMG